ncbi:MAG: hypothetical protein AAF316_00140 [Cyanobacteria bacterium P01_A01_bin.80]
MSTKNYLTVNAQGIKSLVPAISTSTGVSEAEQIIMTDTTGKLSSTLFPPGQGQDTESIVASEALNAGDFVNIWDDSGTRKARKADATNGRYINGFVLEAVANSGTATVYLSGVNNALSGLTVGERLFLGSAGAVTTTPNTTSGQIFQVVGVAISATSTSFQFSDYILIG